MCYVDGTLSTEKLFLFMIVFGELFSHLVGTRGEFSTRTADDGRSSTQMILVSSKICITGGKMRVGVFFSREKLSRGVERLGTNPHVTCKRSSTKL